MDVPLVHMPMLTLSGDPLSPRLGGPYWSSFLLISSESPRFHLDELLDSSAVSWSLCSLFALLCLVLGHHLAH
eukprot:scaffold10803_cov36-Tisochrysis_lutea.AAC.2